MRNYLWLVVLLSMAVTFASCQKEFELADGNQPTEKPSEMGERLKTYTEKLISEGGEKVQVAMEFKYNSQNKLSSIDVLDMVRTNLTFNYPNAKTVAWNILFNGETVSSVEVYQNVRGQIDSSFQISDGEKYSSRILYNFKGLPTTQYEYSFTEGAWVLENETRYTYDAEDKVIKSEDSFGERKMFEYYDDVVGKLPVTIPVFDVLSRKGKLVKTIRAYLNQELEGVIDMKYTFDSKLRIVSVENTERDSGVQVVQVYTYY